MGLSYKASFLSPAILIILVSFILNFSLIFTESMAHGLNGILIYLGSGNIKVFAEYEPEVDGEKFFIKESSSLAFSESSTAPLFLKAVDFDTYFTSEKKKILNLNQIGEDGLNPIIMSERALSELSLNVGDRFTALIYEAEKDRTRPVLFTVSSSFNTGYSEFDSSLAFVPFSILDSPVFTEIIINDKANEDGVLAEILDSGYSAASYKRIYASLYNNIELSLNTLYLVFLLLALLAAFFSSNISFNYIERDKKDIALLYLTGLSLKDIKTIYVKITMAVVIFSLAFGLALAVAFSFFSPSLLSLLSSSGFRALDAYLLSFDIIMPFSRLILINAFLLLCSYLSLTVSLRSIRRSSIKDLLST